MKTFFLCIGIGLLIFSGCDSPVENVAPLSVPAVKDVLKTADHLAIEKVIQNYFDGWLTGDTTLVGSAMHSSCHLKFIRDGKLDMRNRTQYLSGFKPRPRLENAEGRIIDIDITRTAAEAKIELETATRIFTDYFNLLNIDDRWYITDKVSTSIGKEKAE